MTDTSKQEPRLLESSPIGKLSRMLRSTLRSFPNAKMCVMQDAFGVYLGEGAYLHIHYSTHLASADMRDLLVLFATWLVADEGRIRGDYPDLDGASVEALTRYAPFSSRQS
jgi:hypothetical protein